MSSVLIIVFIFNCCIYLLDFHNPCLRAYCPQLCIVINGTAQCVCTEKTTSCQPGKFFVTYMEESLGLK